MLNVYKLYFTINTLLYKLLVKLNCLVFTNLISLNTLIFKLRVKLNICEKVTGKSFRKKTQKIKKIGEKSHFSEVLGQNITDRKVLSFRKFQILGLYFRKLLFRELFWRILLQLCFLMTSNTFQMYECDSAYL